MENFIADGVYFKYNVTDIKSPFNLIYMPEFEQLFLSTSPQEILEADYEVSLEFTVFRMSGGTLQVLTLPAGHSPFEGDLALPGCHLGTNSIINGAEAYLCKKLRLQLPIHLEQITTYISSSTAHSTRRLTIVLMGIVSETTNPNLPCPKGIFVKVPEVTSQITKSSLTIHDSHIIQISRNRLGELIQSKPLGTLLCSEIFTIGQLRNTYETIWNTKLDPANFRKRILKSVGFVEFVSKTKPNSQQGRPAHLYKRGPLNHLYPSLQKPLSQSR